jgi:hypothetical protein
MISNEAHTRRKRKLLLDQQGSICCVEEQTPSSQMAAIEYPARFGISRQNHEPRKQKRKRGEDSGAHKQLCSAGGKKRNRKEKENKDVHHKDRKNQLSLNWLQDQHGLDLVLLRARMKKTKFEKKKRKKKAPTNDEMSCTVILTNKSMPERFTRTSLISVKNTRKVQDNNNKKNKS